MARSAPGHRSACRALLIPAMRLGIDLGGTKIAGVLLDDNENEAWSMRSPAPRGDYDKTLTAIAGICQAAREAAREPVTVGIGIPGSIAPGRGIVQNANSTWLNGRPLKSDLEKRLGTAVRVANDANCFALSEAEDGAAAGAKSVFGVILGTGCGGGFVMGSAVNYGPLGIGGEWGHTPLPHPRPEELPGPQCWCGQSGCLETWISGPAMARDHLQRTGKEMSAKDIAKTGADPACDATLRRHLSRLARGLSIVVNILDPEVIVLGGGLSHMPHLYRGLPDAIAPYVFSPFARIDIRPPRFGDASVVRGAARLWPKGAKTLE